MMVIDTIQAHIYKSIRLSYEVTGFSDIHSGGDVPISPDSSGIRLSFGSVGGINGCGSPPEHLFDEGH